jgi:hypothetical protein
MKFSKRFDTIEPYLFVAISRTISEKKKKGIDVISFGIGDPDIPTPKFVLDSMKKHSDNPANHRYPESEGLPEFRFRIPMIGRVIRMLFHRVQYKFRRWYVRVSYSKRDYINPLLFFLRNSS